MVDLVVINLGSSNKTQAGNTMNTMALPTVVLHGPGFQTKYTTFVILFNQWAVLSMLIYMCT